MDRFTSPHSPLDTQLNQLENQRLIRRDQEPDPTFLFNHVLTQQTVYSTMLKTRRREIHRCVAETYAHLYAGHLSDYAPLLAFHFEEAGADEQALTYSLLAGDGAARLYANAEAIAHFERAILAARRLQASGASPDLWGAPLEQAFRRRGRAFELAGRYQEAVENYIEMEKLGHASALPHLELAALILRGTIHSTQNALTNPQLARDLSGRGLALAEKLDDGPAQAHIYWNMLLSAVFNEGNPIQARAYGEKSLALARRYGLREQLAMTLNDLGYAYLNTGETEKALTAREEARVLLRELDNQPMLADNLTGSSLAAITAGRYRASLSWLDEAFAISLRIGNAWGQAYSRLVQAAAYRELGEFDRSIRAAHTAIEFGSPVPGFNPGAPAAVFLAGVYLLLGDSESGLQALHAPILAFKTFASSWTAWPAAVQARLEVARGNLPAAQAILAGLGAADLASFFGKLFPPAASDLHFARAELAQALGDLPTAAAIVDDLLSLLRSQNIRHSLAAALALKGDLLLQQNRPDEAEPLLQAALREVQETECRRMLWTIYDALARLAASRGDSAAARSWLSQAQAAAAALASQAGSPELRDSFLRQPPVARLFQPAGGAS